MAAPPLQALIGYAIGLYLLLGDVKLFAREPQHDEGSMMPDWPEYSWMLKRFAEAIAFAEGWYVVGSIPQRLNNPGDLKTSGIPSIGQDAQGHLHFASPDDGWRALYRQLQIIVDGKSAHYSLGMTILQMGDKYAPGSVSWPRNVAARLNVSTGTRLREVLL